MVSKRNSNLKAELISNNKIDFVPQISNMKIPEHHSFRKLFILMISRKVSKPFYFTTFKYNTSFNKPWD